MGTESGSEREAGDSAVGEQLEIVDAVGHVTYGDDALSNVVIRRPILPVRAMIVAEQQERNKGYEARLRENPRVLDSSSDSVVEGDEIGEVAPERDMVEE